jgi:hypothetical protein
MPESSPRSGAAWYRMRRMSYFRSISATLLSAAVSFSLVSASGCGTAAIGVDDCRDIEQARCRAAKPCGLLTDVDSCERYYRDHCLHGLPAKLESGASAGACVEVIEAAGRCAETDATLALEDCADSIGTAKSGFKVCDVVVHPERVAECAFLSDLPDDDTGSAGQGAGGQSGTDSDADSSAAVEAAQGGAAVE